MVAMHKRRFAIHRYRRLLDRNLQNEHAVVPQREFLTMRDIVDERSAKQERRIVGKGDFAELLSDEIVAVHPGVQFELARPIIEIFVARDDNVGVIVARLRELLDVRPGFSQSSESRKRIYSPLAAAIPATTAQSFPNWSCGC